VDACRLKAALHLSLMRMNRIKEISFDDAVAIVATGRIHRRPEKRRRARRNYSIRRTQRA
jgi:hypothetical protein